MNETKQESLLLCILLIKNLAAVSRWYNRNRQRRINEKIIQKLLYFYILS